MSNDENEIVVDFKVECPFCMGEVYVFTVKFQGVGHSLPQCQRFAALDPIDFLHEVNKAKRPPN